MKVLHVLRSPRSEGTVKLVLDWLHEPGLKQEVFVLQSDPPELAAALRSAAHWYDQAPGLPAGVAKYPWMVGKLAAICRRRNPDLVICWTNGFAPWVLLGAWLAGVTKLLTHAGNPPTRTAWGGVQTVTSTFVTWLTGGRMICCSRYVAGQFARAPGAFASVLRVAYNCAAVPSIRETAAAARSRRRDLRPVLIMVATLEPHKDHATLLRAMPAVAEAIPEVRLLLVGEGTLRAELEGKSTALGLTSIVKFLGSRRDVPALLGASDVFVFSTTRQEGLGTVLIEGLAAGLPIVASDVPACREALANGNWGTLVPAGDAAALAAALVATLRRRPAGENNARNEYLGNFSPAGMIAAYVALAA